MILHDTPSTSTIAAPADLASVERMILHYTPSTSTIAAPADLASVERMILHYEVPPREPLLLPSPHRGGLSATIKAAAMRGGVGWQV